MNNFGGEQNSSKLLQDFGAGPDRAFTRGVMLSRKGFEDSKAGGQDDSIWLSRKALGCYGALAVLLFGLVVSVVIAHVQGEKNIWLLQLKTTKDLDHWGQIGDFVGGILNPIFSFAAFIMLLFTFSRQIEEGKKTDRNDKKLLNNHRFFELISLMHEVARGVELDDGGTTYTNHRAIGRTWNIFWREYLISYSVPGSALYPVLRVTYMRWRKIHWPVVGTFFESAYFIIDQYIALSDMDEAGRSEDNQYFTLALKAQMSGNERNIMFLEMLFSEEWHEKMDLLHRAGFWKDADAHYSEDRGVLIEQAITYYQQAKKNPTP